MKHTALIPLLSLLAIAGCSQEAATVREESNAAPPTSEEATSGPQSCLAELGEADAQVLVDQCLSISPATRPPCNVQNDCQMIRDEIRRGCNFGDGADNPDFCADYE